LLWDPFDKKLNFSLTVSDGFWKDRKYCFELTYQDGYPDILPKFYLRPRTRCIFHPNVHWDHGNYVLLSREGQRKKTNLLKELVIQIQSGLTNPFQHRDDFVQNIAAELFLYDFNLVSIPFSLYCCFILFYFFSG
jgi:ubiquitin-protein ligase